MGSYIANINDKFKYRQKRRYLEKSYILAIFGFMIGVLTGDIINSRAVESPEIYLKKLKAEFQAIGNYGKDWEIYRGDSFQLRVNKPEELLLEGIKIKSSVKTIDKLDVRIALGVGTINYEAPSISESNGDVFIRSGEVLKKLIEEDLTMGFSSPWNEIDERINLMLKLAVTFMDNWTTRMAEAVYHSLKNPGYTQKEIGALLKIKQNTVSDLLSRARMNEVRQLINYFNKEIGHATG